MAIRSWLQNIVEGSANAGSGVEASQIASAIDESASLPVRGEMDREAAFDTAEQLISALPCRHEVIDFWDMPMLSSEADRKAWASAARRLEQLASEVTPDLSFYFLGWASDAAVGAGDLQRGLDLLPCPAIGGRASSQASKILDLKLELGYAPAARDITALFGPKVTTFGKENLPAIEQYIQLQIDERAKAGDPLRIETWTADAHQHRGGYGLFSGHASYIVTRPPTGWHFTYSKQAEADCIALIRDAENTWREESDLPRVGEGWVSETRLYYSIKGGLPDMEVIQHHRPDWLGKQHLDISIPSLSIAIEYQGAQHDQPVAFFGGETAFQRTVERDRRKLNLCRRHGWRLIYVREGYSLPDVLRDILA